MKRDQLEHVLRAASAIANDPNVVVIGSQSILGAISEDRLPEEATASIEVDVAFIDDADDAKSDLVDGAIGEMSLFHQTHGYYGQGVSVSTAVYQLVGKKGSSSSRVRAPHRVAASASSRTTVSYQSWSPAGIRTLPLQTLS